MSKSIIMGKVFWIIRITLAVTDLLLATGCKKEEITRDIVKITHWPTVKALEVTDKTNSSATLNGTVNTYGLPTTTTFEYGTTASYGSIVIANQIPLSGDSIIDVGASISGLTPDPIYHFRVRAENSLWTNFYSSDKTFTVGEAPDAHTAVATNISPIGATLNGTVNACGLPATVTFEYGPTTSYGNTLAANPGTVTGSITTSVSADITGLTAGTTYHFRVRAEKSCGTAYGSDVELILGQAPTVTTLEATNLTSSTATLNGIVNANYFLSNVRFEYGPTTSYGQEVIPEQSPVTGNAGTNVSATLSGLTCGIKYYFRVKAENSFGISYGNDKTFSSAHIPVLTASVSGITDTSAILEGNIVDDECAAVTMRGFYWTPYSGALLPSNHTGRGFFGTLNGSGTGSYTHYLTRLNPSTIYSFQPYARNSNGNTRGKIISFKTLSSGK